jgi:hypothetical protein
VYAESCLTACEMPSPFAETLSFLVLQALINQWKTRKKYHRQPALDALFFATTLTSKSPSATRSSSALLLLLSLGGGGATISVR